MTEEPEGSLAWKYATRVRSSRSSRGMLRASEHEKMKLRKMMLLKRACISGHALQIIWMMKE